MFQDRENLTPLEERVLDSLKLLSDGFRDRALFTFFTGSTLDIDEDFDLDDVIEDIYWSDVVNWFRNNYESIRHLLKPGMDR